MGKKDKDIKNENEEKNESFNVIGLHTKINELEAQLAEALFHINKLYEQHDNFRKEVSEVIQSLPEMLKQFIEKQGAQESSLENRTQEKPQDQVQEQQAAPQQTNTSQQQSVSNIDQNNAMLSEALKLEALMKQSDIELADKLKEMNNLEKLIFLSRNLQGAIGLISMLKGENSNHNESQDIGTSFETWLKSVQGIFGVMMNMFKMAADTVSQTQKNLANTKVIESIVEDVIEKKFKHSEG